MYYQTSEIDLRALLPHIGSQIVNRRYKDTKNTAEMIAFYITNIAYNITSLHHITLTEISKSRIAIIFEWEGSVLGRDESNVAFEAIKKLSFLFRKLNNFRISFKHLRISMNYVAI